MSWHRGHSARKLSNNNPYVSALELHEKNGATDGEGDDLGTNTAPNGINNDTSVVSTLDLNEKPGAVATQEDANTKDDATRPKDINAETPHVMILEVHDKTGALAVREEADSLTNDDATLPEDLFPAKQQSLSSDTENKGPTQSEESEESNGPTQPELATQIWLKTHHPDHQPVKLLPPSEKTRLAPPPKKLPPPSALPTSGPAQPDQPELVRNNTLQKVHPLRTLQNAQPSRNLDLQNVYAQRMMKSLLQYDEKQLKQMLVMGILSPVEVSTTQGTICPFLATIVRSRACQRV